MSPISSTSSSATTGASNSNLVTSADATADKNMFLQLLVAQLKNQDPSQPMDSSTFVTQLAQFQQLEATTNMQTDISAMHSDDDQILSDENQVVASITGSSAASTTSGASTNTNSNTNTGTNGTTQTS